MKRNVPIVVLFLLASLILGCSSGPSEKPSSTNQPESSSLFQNKTSPDTGAYPYQTVYPGNSIDTNSLVIGLDAAMTGDFAKSGVSIWRGMVLAVDEINSSGGLLGRKLQILVKDHQANPERGLENIQNFAEVKNLLAVMGGMHTPVVLHELPAIHNNNIISLVPWAAGTPIVNNGYEPNYVFRLSVRDQQAGPYLVQKLSEAGYQNPALLLENTDWGRSNRKAIKNALQAKDLSPAKISIFNWTKKSFKTEIKQARKQGADSIIFVGNSPEGATLVRSMADQDESERLPIISHWGITGGEFYEKTKSALPNVTLRVLQTRSFLDPANPEYARQERQTYCQKFTCVDDKIFAPVGTAHAHDLVHLLGRAVQNAGSDSRPNIQKNLETLDSYRGILRVYDPPFTDQDHEALSVEDYRLARYDSSGNLVLENF